ARREPWGDLAMAITMQVKNGFFNSECGFDYPQLLLAISVAVGVAGPGAYLLDVLFASPLPQVRLLGVLAVAVVRLDVVGTGNGNGNGIGIGIGIGIGRRAATPAPTGRVNAVLSHSTTRSALKLF